MKKNEKGFTLLETLVVSTFVVGTIVFLFSQFVVIKKNYTRSLKYDNVDDIYIAKNLKQFFEIVDIQGRNQTIRDYAIGTIQGSSTGDSAQSYVNLVNNPDIINEEIFSGNFKESYNTLISNLNIVNAIVYKHAINNEEAKTQGQLIQEELKEAFSDNENLLQFASKIDIADENAEAEGYTLILEFDKNGDDGSLKYKDNTFTSIELDGWESDTYE